MFANSSGEEATMNAVISDIAKINPIAYDWGALKWVCDEEIAPGCEQSFGFVYLLPGKTNPLHWHTTAQELVYVLSGECDIRFDGQVQRLVPGLTLCIPPGVRHELTNHGWEPFIYVASFSAPRRGTVFENPGAAGALPKDSLY
jgi:quercetin dioxygenase-like cupin family protein